MTNVSSKGVSSKNVDTIDVQINISSTNLNYQQDEHKKKYTKCI